MTQNSPPPLTSVTLSFAGSLLVTGTAVYFLDAQLHPHSLSLMQLFSLACIYVVATALVHMLTVWAICRVFREQIQVVSAWPLITGMWISIAWLPSLIVSFQQKLLWIALVLPLIFACAALFFKTFIASAQDTAVTSPPTLQTLTLFQAPKPRQLVRAILPAAVIAIALQAGLSLIAFGHLLIAGALFSLCAFMAVWITSSKPQPKDPLKTPRVLLIQSLLALLFTAFALLPLLQSRRIPAYLAGLLHKPPVPAPQKAHTGDPIPSSAYSGVILLALSDKPREKILPPPPATEQFAGTHIAKPIIIPFDGAYWYFKHPARRPRPDARIVHGDPTKRTIRSTDFVPISMEAHQRLGSSIPLSCCSSIRVAIRNADNRIGSISIELLLTDTAANKNSTLSLSSEILRSSQNRTLASFNRPPVDETLTFPIPPVVHSKSFDQITLVIQPSTGTLAGAHVAIQQFTLVP